MGDPVAEQASARRVTVLRPGPREARPLPARIRRPPAARVAMAHGAFLTGVGLMPIIALRAFRKITGREPEGWRGKGVGACLANIGGALLCAGARGKVAREVRILGISTALSFAAMDLWAGAIRRRRSPVYLLNGLAQLAFA